MFEEMIGDIKEETVKFCYNVTITTTTERKSVMKGGEGRKDEYKDQGAGGDMPKAAPKAEDTQKPETYRRAMPKVGRNDPCPCGSGKKYKNCCMGKDLEQ